MVPIKIKSKSMSMRFSLFVSDFDIRIFDFQHFRVSAFERFP